MISSCDNLLDYGSKTFISNKVLFTVSGLTYRLGATIQPMTDVKPKYFSTDSHPS